MKILLVSVLFVISTGFQVFAQDLPDSLLQVTDTVVNADSVAKVATNDNTVIKDSVSKRPANSNNWSTEKQMPCLSRDHTWQVLQHNPYFGFEKTVVSTAHANEDLRHITGKEKLFYVIVFLLLSFAFIRNLFPKYFNDLFRLFFRTTIKQRQIREQLMQTPLPSLLMNGFFVVSAGLYIAFVLGHYGLNPVANFWILVFYVVAGLSAAYTVKFLGLKLSGWLFNMQEAANAYIFIVFIVNKMIGILLLPFIVLLAFTVQDVHFIALNLSWFMIAGLLAYRFILTYLAVRNQVKVNPFHLFLYLLAFEIAPLLLVYKGLLVFFSRTA